MIIISNDIFLLGNYKNTNLDAELLVELYHSENVTYCHH